MNQSNLNIFSIDFEEWYMVTSFDKFIEKCEWGSLEKRLDYQTSVLLNLLDKYETKVTFFVVGNVAKDKPGLIKKISECGHEIASHSNRHTAIHELGPSEFKSDLIKSKEILEGLTGKEVTGFRAPSWSLNKTTEWAVDILLECGFKYDSSVFPIAVRYGWKKSERNIYRFKNGLLEFPLSTIRIAGKNIPVGGGAFLRIQPLSLTKYAINEYGKNNNPFIVYIHPWEIDPAHPKIKTNLKSYIIHYFKLNKTMSKISNLLKNYNYTSFEQYLLSQQFKSKMKIGKN